MDSRSITSSVSTYTANYGNDVDTKWITTSSTYGLYGNLATTTDARGNARPLGYDALNRMTSISEKLNGTDDKSFRQSYAYDPWGNRLIDAYVRLTL